MNTLFDLTGKRALITGSSQGIGYTLAQGLAKAGAEVIINGRHSDKVIAAAKTLRADQAIVYERPFDVTDYQQTQQTIDAFEKEIGAIDILVNNAGIQHRAPLEDFPVEAFEKIMRANVHSIFNVGQAVARHMIQRQQGKIINIASIQTALARPTIAPYTASKGAVGNLTKGMATDWAKYGLQINAIAPGYFDTPLNAALVNNAEFSAWIGQRTPAGRWGKLEELIGACIFLASPAASFVNGHILYVDGGMSACV